MSAKPSECPTPFPDGHPDKNFLKSVHTFAPDCPACVKFKEANKMSPEDLENAALVDALMVQWDSMITQGAQLLSDRIRAAGRKRLQKFKERYIEPPKEPEK